MDDDKSHLAAPHQGISADDLSPDVERVLDELGASASGVIIERMKDGKPGEWDYMARVSADEYKTEYIKEQFGGGDYRVVIIDAVKGRLNPVFVSVDKRFVGKLFAGVVTPVPANGANDPFRDRLLEVLLAKALTPAAPAPNTSRETIELVLAVVGAVKGGDGASSLEQMKTMFDMSKSIAEMANPPEGFAAVASNFLPVIERLVPPRQSAAAARVQHTRALPPPAAAAAAAPAAAARNPLASAPVRTVEASTPAHVAGSIIPKWLEPFRAYAGQLTKVADRGSDPTMYADMALEEVQDDDETFAAAVAAMNEDRLLSDLFAVCPALETSEKRKDFAQQFVDAFRAGLQEIVNSPDEDETATGETASNG